MFQDLSSLTGRVDVKLFGPDGELKQHVQNHNLVVTAGKNWLPTFLAGTNTSQMNVMAIGISAPTIAATDVTLGGEVSNPRVIGTLATSNNLYQVTATFPANNPSSSLTDAITEAGIFNHNVNNTGSMYTHASFAAVNKAPADTLQIVWQITNS